MRYTKYNIMKKTSRKLIEVPNLRERVYQALKEMIIIQEIPPGEKLDEDRLASQLGVSRTPVRESLCRLENEGIVKIIPRRGAFIVRHSKESINEILSVREVLEGLSAREAVSHITDATLEVLESLSEKFSESNVRLLSKEYLQADVKFHKTIIEQSKNEWLISLMNILNDHIQMLRLRTVTLQGRPEHSLSEHRKILGALKARDPLLAESLMREHIKNVRESYLKNIEVG
jgi:DNA-binding GntR family transcriptional regulator